jgi:hypothetical protein
MVIFPTIFLIFPVREKHALHPAGKRDVPASLPGQLPEPVIPSEKNRASE